MTSCRTRPGAIWRASGFVTAAALLLLGVLAAGCTKEHNTIVEAHLGEEASAAQIDQDPWALLPAGPVAWAYLDAPQLFASRFGPTLTNLVSRRIPALGEAGFEPTRDIQGVHLGVYSIQGADLVGVVSGHFNPEQIEAAVEKNPVTPLGIQLTKTRYGGRSLFMAESSGFTILTPQTALFGNQMGMRRAIDRIERGRLERNLPEWLTAQLQTGSPPVVVGMNLKDNPLSDATRQDLPFLKGMTTLGVLANFQEPGLNLAGTASYVDEDAARVGAANLEQLDDYLQSMGWVMALFGIAQPLRSLTAQASGTEARFVAAVDGEAVNRLLSQLDRFLPTAPSPPVSSAAPGTPTLASPPLPRAR